MKNLHSIERLEARIAPAATVVLDPIKLIMTITADPAGDDLTIVQANGAIDVLDNANGGASLMPTGGPENVRGIKYIGGAGDDKTVVQLENGNVGVAGFIDAPSLPEGFILMETGGTNDHTIEGTVDYATIGKLFQFIGGSGDDTFHINKVAREKDFTFTGGEGTDTLDLQGSTITGKFIATGIESMTSGGNRQIGSVTIDNSKSINPADLTIAAELISGIVKYTGSASDDRLTINGAVNGAISMLGKEGTDSFSLTGHALKAVTFKGGAGDDNFSLTGVALGAINADMGIAGDNTVDIIAAMAGSAITLKGGAGLDTFNVTAFNAGALTATLGDGQDVISTAGIFKSLRLDAGLGSGQHNGAEKTIGKTTRKNFI